MAGASAAGQESRLFFRGKQLNLIVGYSPGGGYDSYARLIARHIGRYIPGRPQVVIQNMPGAGSLVATNYLYRLAARDGTVFGTFARNMPLVGLLGTKQNVQFDPRQFGWLGSSSSFENDAYLLLVSKAARAKSLDDIRDTRGVPLVIGSTAEGSSSDAIPAMLRDLLKLNVRAIGGYTDSSQLFLAMERGEIEGRTVGLSAVRANKPGWLAKDGPMRVLLVIGRADRHRNYPNVPTARELAKTERERQLIAALELPYKVSRPYAAPPGLPPERLKALQAAFLSVHEDPKFRQEAARSGLELSPIGAEEVMGLIEKVATIPPSQLKAIEDLIKSK
jgi:tripartite-type tricarboxylate transporter receptor subunit TctC